MELKIGQGKEIELAKIKVDVVEPHHTPKTQVNESKLVIQKKNLTFSEKRKKLAEDKKNKKAKKQYLKGFNASEAENNLLKLYQKGQYSESEMLAVFITKQFPEHQFSWKILGAIYAQTGRLSEALVAGKKAVHLMPKDADALNNLGTTLNSLGKIEEAEATLGQAIALQPDSADAHNNMGNALTDKGDLGAAIDSYKRALQIKPDFAVAYYNMGVALKANDDPDGAIDSYQKALKIRPDYAEAYNNLGDTLNEEGKLDSAIDNLKQAIKIKPDFADASYNLAYPYLLLGSLEKGFNFYESRLRKTKPTLAPARAHLIWDGEKSLSGKHFVIYEEQGLGDIIQFCRYLPLLEQKGANITFKVKPNLHALLQTMDSNSRLVSSISEENEIDFEVPLMSVPHLLNTSLETIPAISPYLFADQEKIQTWGERVSTDKFKVGICWQGSKSNTMDGGRSFPLSLFEGISKIPHVELISLHKGEGEAQMAGIDFHVTTLGHDFDAGQDAFLDTAAVMMNCNLIITACTSIAHLAGAIGRPTWVALKQIPDWRWMLDRPDSPWYPTMTLYRQKSRGDWVHVFDTIERDLRTMLKQNKAAK